MTTTTTQIDPFPDVASPTGAGQTAENSTELVRCENCGRYGWHTTDRCPDVTPPEDIARMTTTTVQINPYPVIAPPPGADAFGDWVDEEPWRIIYGQRHEIGAIVTGAWACQLPDGSVRENDGSDVYLDEMDKHGHQCERLNLSVAEARQLSQALLAAADTADGWVAR